MCFCDTTSLNNEQIYYPSSANLRQHENSIDIDQSFNSQFPLDNRKKNPNFNCSCTSKNLNNIPNSSDPLSTLFMIKKKLKELDAIAHSENFDENILYESNINIAKTPIKTPISLKSKKIKPFEPQEPKEVEDNYQYSYFKSETQYDLFQEILEENEILKRDKEILEKTNVDLNNKNNDLLKKEKDYDYIKSEFSKLLSRFGKQNDSKSIIDMYDEKQEKLDKIFEILSISPESDPIFEINNLIQEKRENDEKLKKAKSLLNYIVDRYEKLVFESENSKKEVLDFIILNNQQKENQKKNMNFIILLAVLIASILYCVISLLYF